VKKPPTVVALDQLTAAGQAWAGAKAYNCARLMQAGFPYRMVWS
jgi:hypothetical protein